jgi:hypothetical protein
MDGACNMHGEMRNEYKILVLKPEGKGPLRRPRHRSEAMLKWVIDMKGVDWIHLAQDRADGGLL